MIASHNFCAPPAAHPCCKSLVPPSPKSVQTLVTGETCEIHTIHSICFSVILHSCSTGLQTEMSSCGHRRTNMVCDNAETTSDWCPTLWQKIIIHTVMQSVWNGDMRHVLETVTAFWLAPTFWLASRIEVLFYHSSSDVWYEHWLMLFEHRNIM